MWMLKLSLHIKRCRVEYLWQLVTATPLAQGVFDQTCPVTEFNSNKQQVSAFLVLFLTSLNSTNWFRMKWITLSFCDDELRCFCLHVNATIYIEPLHFLTESFKCCIAGSVLVSQGQPFENSFWLYSLKIKCRSYRVLSSPIIDILFWHNILPLFQVLLYNSKRISVRLCGSLVICEAGQVVWHKCSPCYVCSVFMWLHLCLLSIVLTFFFLFLWVVVMITPIVPL